MLYRLQYEYLEEFFQPDAVYPNDEWLKEAINNILCPECLSIKRDCFPLPIDIILANRPNEDPEDQPIVNIETTGITIILQSVLEIMKDHLSHFVLGKCFLADGSVLDKYATCYSKKYVVIRGSQYSNYDICPLCGTIKSNVRPGPEYILTRDMSEEKIYQDAVGNLYLTEEIAWNLNLSIWEGIGKKPIAIRETPADGQKLPCDA